jgi:hypothetical protein
LWPDKPEKNARKSEKKSPKTEEYSLERQRTERAQKTSYCDASFANPKHWSPIVDSVVMSVRAYAFAQVHACVDWAQLYCLHVCRAICPGRPARPACPAALMYAYCRWQTRPATCQPFKLSLLHEVESRRGEGDFLFAGLEMSDAHKVNLC